MVAAHPCACGEQEEQEEQVELEGSAYPPTQLASFMLHVLASCNFTERTLLIMHHRLQRILTHAKSQKEQKPKQFSEVKKKSICKISFESRGYG